VSTVVLLYPFSCYLVGVRHSERERKRERERERERERDGERVPSCGILWERSRERERERERDLQGGREEGRDRTRPQPTVFQSLVLLAGLKCVCLPPYPISPLFLFPREPPPDD
jgi:hypothetical protein